MIHATWDARVLRRTRSMISWSAFPTFRKIMRGSYLCVAPLSPLRTVIQIDASYIPGIQRDGGARSTIHASHNARELRRTCSMFARPPPRRIRAMIRASYVFLPPPP